MSRRPSGRAARRAPPSSAELFAALGNETRLRLVRRLSSGGPSSIARLAAGSPISRQAVTKHLQVLARAGVVSGSRRGREHLWQLEPDRVQEAQRWLDGISARWDQALERLRLAVEEP
jgi:DNA-binding transcriptional ArsR family regulator